MLDKLISILKESTVSFPKLLLTHYHVLNIDDKDLVMLIYLINDKDLAYNPKKISDELHIPLNNVLEMINELVAKDILKIEIKKVNNMRTEYISLDSLYHKLAFKVLNEEEKKDHNSLYSTFEREFGRTLSPIEYELISGWQGSNEFSDELILLALKEAVYNGAFNFRYIDKILYEWKKKNIKSKADVEADHKSFKTKKAEELVDYDWLNEKKDN